MKTILNIIIMSSELPDSISRLLSILKSCVAFVYDVIVKQDFQPEHQASVTYVYDREDQSLSRFQM